MMKPGKKFTMFGRSYRILRRVPDPPDAPWFPEIPMLPPALTRSIVYVPWGAAFRHRTTHGRLVYLGGMR